MRVSSRELAGWGNFPRATCRVAELTHPPRDLGEFANGARLTPRGLGRSYGDASLAPADAVAVLTESWDQVHAFDEATGLLAAGAGISLEAIIDRALPSGWFLPVTPGTRFVTLGGAIGTNVHGKNHHCVGAFDQFIHSLELLTEAGPMRVDRQSSPDLFEATLGGFGMTGLVLAATIQLRRVETAWLATRVIRAANLAELFEILARHDETYEYSITWVDVLAKGAKLGRGVVMLGRHSTQAELPTRLQARPLEHRWRRTRRAPRWLGGWVTGRTANRLFNLACYHARREDQPGLSTAESFFYPLDSLRDWNGLYGADGFVQYQLVLPDSGNARRGIRRVLELLVERRAGSFVAGLKRMRRDSILLPFGMEGYTFGIDFARRLKGLDDLLAALDRIVIEHGGRVCLSKDARLSPATFRRMYPEFEHWRQAVRRFSPTGRFTSQLAERLQLREP